MKDRQGSAGVALAIAGGALLAVGSFMTWASASFDVATFAQALGVDAATVEAGFNSAGVGTSISVAGLDGSDGKITLVLGLLAIAGGIVLAMRKSRKLGAALVLVGGVLGTLVALYDITKAKDDALSQAGAEFAALGLPISLDEIFKVTIGIGLWICLIGGIIALVGGAMSLRGGAMAAGGMAGDAGAGGEMAGSGAGGFMPPVPPVTPPAPQAPTMGGTGSGDAAPTPVDPPGDDTT